MDIEYEATPPKKMKKYIQYSTPNRKTTPKDTQTPKKSRINYDQYQTPEKCQKNMQMETPPKKYQMQTPPKKGQNPQSRKLTKKLSESPYSSCKSPVQWLSSQKIITPFILSRLQTDYEFIKNLGMGNFSKVSLYKSRLTKQLFAIKITQISLMSLNEIQALGTLSIFNQKSKHIVKYYHSWIQDDRVYIVMEYCQSSVANLYDSHLQQKKMIEQKTLKQILKESLLGLKCMHQHNMVHLDIKPENLLMKDKEVKIADLGLCRITRIKKWSDLDEGDSRYLAKQILNYHPGIDLTKSDIFSLGMSIFQGAILQTLPNNGEKWLQIRQKGIDFSQIPQMSNYSAQFKEILSMMIKPNWYERLSSQKLLEHKYFVDQKNPTNNKRLSRFMRIMDQQLGDSRKKQTSM